MSFDLLNNLIKKPWAIDPAYVEAITPFIAGLLQGEPMKWEKVVVSSPYSIDARANNNGNIGTAPKGSIAVISLNGPMLKNDQFCGPIGTSTIALHIQEAEANINIDGII